MKEYHYDYYQVKADLDEGSASRLEKIMEEKGIRLKGVLLRELILNFLKLVDQNGGYQEEQEEADYLTSLYGGDFGWTGYGEIISQRALRRREYIPKKDK